MDLNSGLLITRNIAHELPVTDVVIKAVEVIAYTQGFKSLKFKNRHGVVFHDADWIAGVDYDNNDNDDNENEDNEYNHQNEDDEIEEEFEQLDQQELDDLISDERTQGNPTVQHENEEEPENTPTEQEPIRRSIRATRPIETLEPTLIGQSYTQEGTKVTFQDVTANTQLEYCHNLIVQTKPDPKHMKEYDTSEAMIMARLITDLNSKVTIEGASFGQAYLIDKGIKIYGQ
jgi:hypothetical protein